MAGWWQQRCCTHATAQPSSPGPSYRPLYKRARPLTGNAPCHATAARRTSLDFPAMRMHAHAWQRRIGALLDLHPNGLHTRPPDEPPLAVRFRPRRAAAAALLRWRLLHRCAGGCCSSPQRLAADMHAMCTPPAQSMSSSSSSAGSGALTASASSRSLRSCSARSICTSGGGSATSSTNCRCGSLQRQADGIPPKQCHKGGVRGYMGVVKQVV